MDRPILRALVECSVTDNPSVGFQTCGQTVSFESPFVEEEAVFRFDSLHHYSIKGLDENSPVADLLKGSYRIDAPAAGAAPSPLVLFHGPCLSHTAAVFIHAVERVLHELAHSHTLLGADVRLLRLYAWAATDVIGQRIIEQCGYIPPREPCTFDSAIGSAQRLRVVFERFEDELLRVRRVLRDALILPEGHCAFICSISAGEQRAEGAHTLHLYLLPPLRCASRLFQRDLLALRGAWCQPQELPSATLTNTRLARFLIEANAKSILQVFTVLGTASVQSAAQSFYLQCCYGSRVPSSALEKYCFSPLVPLCSAFDLQPQTVLVESTCAASDKQFVADPTARRLTLSGPNSLEKSNSTPKLAISLDDSFPGADLSQNALKRHPWGTQTTAVVAADLGQCTVEELQQRKVKLAHEAKALSDAVHDLEQYKTQLEDAVGRVLKSLGEATEDLAVEESAMLTEVERATSILGLAEVSSRAQDQQILSRLTALWRNVGTPRGSVKSEQNGS